ncbi:sigma-70 family RNA polymerase sigma factor [Prolixibacter denitrificans]|uniref:DNA-directed RNA polymerase specialized sigma24 family protein n=1 Tax=Prolixibacter denitrificans TaxID=1541063 RepID=A0A2P8CHP8_9BACT|nr:sigma-70 family RNA polymerase sigma factor [Prolixibacter denitrificans]PSK84500.1 DNA-directed RNA polymerase specialized sigma24 family protein [Prolixibacter denitrificans]GET20673.1 hypothetical protein JCM18694_09190 [Prolixibacter denitrificans]
MIDWRNYKETPTTELIELIKSKDGLGNLDIAKAAFRAFYFRFWPVIAKTAERISLNNNFDKEFAVEILERTFKRFWKYPNFRLEKMKASTPDKGVELYLLRIAQNSFYDLLNERKGINVSPYDGSEEIVYDVEIPDELLNVRSEKLIILKKVLETFSWKHKVIYLTYLKYEMQGHKLPRKLLTELREKLDISQDTIRYYRYEVIRKINEYTELWQQRDEV